MIILSDDEIVNISKYKFILTILNILFLFEYQILRCTCWELHFCYLCWNYQMAKVFGYLCNNDIFNNMFSIQWLLIHSIIWIFLQFCVVLSISLISFKNFMFIQKCYIHSKSYFHSKILYSFNNFSVRIYRHGRTVRWSQDFNQKNSKKAAHVSCRVYTKTRNKTKWVGTTWNQLEQAETTWRTRWNQLERDRLSNELTQKTRNL